MRSAYTSAMDRFAAPSSCRIAVHARHRVATVAVHEHALIWVHHGTKTLLSAAGVREFHAGDAVVVFQGSQWDVINDPFPHACYEASVLQFGDDALAVLAELMPAGIAASAGEGRAAPTMDEELAQSMRRAMDTLARVGASPALRQHRVVEVLLLLAERGTYLTPRGELRWQDRLRRLVAQRPYADWSVEVLAGAFHMSSATLRRRLAAEGVRAGDIVRETRLEIGLNLLQTTALSIGEIAQRCGYDSHSRFSAVFRERFGFSPSELRGPAKSCDMSASAQILTPAG
jgi:AraC-like DNA-binding protein